MNRERYRQMLSKYMEPDIVERTMSALNPDTNGLNPEDAIGAKASEKPQIAQAQSSRGEKVEIRVPNGKMIVKKVV